MVIVFILAVASILVSPFRERTMSGYYGRLILLLLTGIGGVFLYYHMTYSTVIWGPILMLTRKKWFPIPADDPTKRAE